MKVRCQVSGVRCQVSGVRCQVSGVRCQVSGVRCQVSGVRCQVSGVRCRMGVGRQKSALRSRALLALRPEIVVGRHPEADRSPKPQAFRPADAAARRRFCTFQAGMFMKTKEQDVRCEVSAGGISTPRSRQADSIELRANCQKTTFQAGMCMKTKSTVRSPRSGVRSCNALATGAAMLTPGS